MRAEHCSLGGHDYELFASNYGITSTPAQEWLYVVGDDKGQRAPCPDMGHGRRIVSIEEHLEKPLAKKAKLTRAEMIAVVLYTGDIFDTCILAHYVHMCVRARDELNNRTHVCGLQRHPPPLPRGAVRGL